MTDTKPGYRQTSPIEPMPMPRMVPRWAFIAFVALTVCCIAFGAWAMWVTWLATKHAIH
jgi:hypothetical protein